MMRHASPRPPRWLAALNTDGFAALAFGLTIAFAVARWLATGEVAP